VSNAYENHEAGFHAGVAPLALLWPTPAGYYVRLGVAVCVAAIWALQASRSKYLRQVAHTTASPKVKYEN
jgi:hypothetical protein